MNTIKPILTGMPVLPLQVPAGPPQTKAPEAQTPPAAPPAPVEIDLGSLLADQKQVDPGKRTGAAFDVKSLNFEQMATKTLERVAQIRRFGGEGQPVVLKAGASQIVIPSAMLNKDALVRLLTDTLAKLSPTDLKAAMDLAQSAQPLVAQIRGESQTDAGAAAQADAKGPAQAAEKAPESLDELFKGNFADEASFNKYAKGFFEGKLGVKSIDAGFIASYLGDALHGDNPGKRIRGLGYVVVRLHELSQRDPKVKEALNRLIAQVEGGVPAGLKPMFTKLFTQKGPSLGHLNNLYIVSQHKMDPPKEAAKTIYASFELLHYFSSDVKGLLPPAAQRNIDKLALLCGRGMDNAVGKVFRRFLPTNQASDFSIAVCKILASESPVARMAGVMDLAKLTGLRLFGDGGHYASLMSFAKIDIDTTVYMKQVFDPASPPQLQAKALKNIVEIYQTRLDKFAAAFPPGTIPASVAAEAEKLLAEIPKDAVAVSEKLAHYGLDTPDALKAALGKLEGFGVENEDQLLSFLQKMGDGHPQTSLEAVAGLKARGITNMDKLGEAFGKLGVRDAVGFEKAFKELGKYGVANIDEAIGLLEKLGAKSTAQAIEALTSLGLKPGSKLSLEALMASVEKAMKKLAPYGVSNAEELLELMKHTGARGVEDALNTLEKTGAQIGKEGVEQLGKLGVKNPAQLSQLLSVLGSKTSAEAGQLLEKFKAFGLKGDEVIKLMDQLGLKGSREADKALRLLQDLGVKSTDVGEKTLSQLKSLGIRYIDRAGQDFARLSKFGVDSLEEAAEAVKLLGVKSLDEIEEATAKMVKAGVPSLQAADTLFRALGDVKSADEALIALDKLRKIGAKTPAEAIDLMKTLAHTQITKVDQALELFSKLGVKDLDGLSKVMPQLEKLSELGVNSGPELIKFIGDMGGHNLKQAVDTLEKLEGLGFKDGKKAIEIAQKLGLEKAGLFARTMEKLGLKASKVEELAFRFSAVGSHGLEAVVELLEKTKLKSAEELIDLFDRFKITSSETMTQLMKDLGCGDDLEKLGATLSTLKEMGIKNTKGALEFAQKLGTSNVSDAVDLTVRFAKAGIKEPREIFKLLEKVGIDIAGKSPAEVFVQMDRLLAMTEEAAKYGLKGVDDVAEMIGKTGARTALELSEKMGARAGKVNVLAKAIGLGDEATGAIIKLVQNGHMSEEVLEKAMSVFKALGREKADTIARVLVHMQPDIVAAVFKNETIAKTLLSGVAELVPKLTKLGIGAAEIGAKLGKGILKALPALGIAMSGADMIRTKTIAITGEWTEIGLKGLGKKTTYNADARGLAAIAGACNTLDTALGIVEWAFPGGGPILTAAPNIGLALTEVALDVMMDHYNEHPMPAQMKNVVEVAAYAAATAQLDFTTVVALNQAYGKAAEHSGQAIAAALQDAKAKPADVEKFISEISKSWVRNTDATRAVFDALGDKRVSLESLTQGHPPRLTQKSLQLLFDNLNSAMTFHSSDLDYERMNSIIKVAGNDLRAHIVTALMDQHTNSDEETLIHHLLTRASDADAREILSQIDVGKLAGELENPAQFKAVLDKIVKIGDARLLRQFIESSDIKPSSAASAAKTLVESGVPLSDKQRGALFGQLIHSGDSKLLQQLLLGGGKLGPVQDKAEQSKMVGLMASRIKDFISISGRDSQQASALAVMVLLHGNQQQVDQAFGNIRQGQWFGNGSDVVRTALDTAKRQGIDIKAKLSPETLKNMVGSIDNGWTKAFRVAHVGKEHAEAERLLLDLARISDVEGKAMIIRDIMDGVTFKSTQTQIATILHETRDPKAFTALINQLDLSRLSTELEKRNDLGQVMADILQRYQGDKNQALRTIMSAWSSASVQSDDILHHMIQSLPAEKRTQLLRQLPPETLNEMIDWTDDAFRDGNLTHLDAESQWSIAQLQAAQQAS